MKKLIALLLALAMVLALAACGGNSGGNNQTGDEDSNLEEVQLNYAELVFSQAGDSAQLEVQGLEDTYTATYTSSD